MNLTEINILQSGTITEVQDNVMISKLFDFGLVPGTVFTVLNRAPFGGPISVFVNDTRIALRKREAKFILVNCNSF